MYGHPQTFFQGGKKHTICPKDTEKDTIFVSVPVVTIVAREEILLYTASLNIGKNTLDYILFWIEHSNEEKTR